jgi:hypothetical protein
MSFTNGMPTAEELKSMPENDLLIYADGQLGSRSVNVFHVLIAQLYLNEFSMRGQDKIAKEVHLFTKQMRTMTVVILVATIFGVGASVLGVLRQFNVI